MIYETLCRILDWIWPSEASLTGPISNCTL